MAGTLGQQAVDILQDRRGHLADAGRRLHLPGQFQVLVGEQADELGMALEMPVHEIEEL